MKRIILLCFLACATCTMALAQTTGPSTTQIDPRTVFASNMGEYDAGIMRNNSVLAGKGFNGAMTVIANSISQLQQQYNSASSQANKAVIAAKLQTQQQLQADLQALQSNIMGNAVTIKNKFQAFQTSMQ